MLIKIAGAGLTGLTAGYRLLKANYQVEIHEKENFAGGLAAGFKQKNWHWNLEHFYHHLFTSDLAIQNLITELGLKNNLFFHSPKTSIYYQNQIHQFDSPLSLLKFPFLSPRAKLRAGLTTLYLQKTTRWLALEKIRAVDWLPRHYGQTAYQILWKPLLKGKFGDKYDQISMAWFWARIHKRSPRLGYLEGGFQTLIDALVKHITALDGKMYFNKIFEKNFSDIVLRTFVPAKIPMLGAVNLILKLKNSFLADGTYWLNVNDASFPFVAVVEHTNFINKKYYGNNHLVYVGGYYSVDHPYFSYSSDKLFSTWFPYLQKINPSFNRLLTVNYSLFTSLTAQPIPPLNYSRTISPVKINKNFYQASMEMVYPYDRGINYAVDLGNRAADEIRQNHPL
ncbi:MAG: FAD-dependent oxidoreductase [Candidatus Shapirobacteria bacterium]